MGVTVMGRLARVTHPGAWHHIMDRGSRKNDIFHSTEDYYLFLGLLGEYFQKHNIELHAYCLMTNHYHLLVHTPNGNISYAMKCLNGVFTQKMNKRYDTDGPIFRGRYKSTLVDEDHYFLTLTRYIHLNPVEAAIVGSPQEYKWSSYRAYLNLEPAPDWLNRAKVYSYFQKNKPEAYERFVMQAIVTDGT